ncbi:MAG TPA: hypothetical protein PK703_05775, partial [Gemmiger qucibialis]|nr:hypothetical protein [Gemmiger qucibialis]
MLVACIIADNRCRVLHKILYQVLCKTPAAQQRAAGAFLSAVYFYNPGVLSASKMASFSSL